MRTRRCDWCLVILRWWQFKYCRRCTLAMWDKYGYSAPCSMGARAWATPDSWR